MRKLTVGNKGRFAVFTIIVIIIIVILILFLNKMINIEKEQYEITKDVFLYDNDYEHVNLSKDAVIAKKWNGKYYLTEPETGLTYDLGTSGIGYDTIKNRLNLFGNFYEVSLDGEVTKKTKKTEVSDMLNSKLYKIDDRKYLVVSPNITIENSSMSAENYLIVVIDKSGNTLLLNNKMDVKTINAIVLQTDMFKFDVANEKLLVNDTKIDLTKIIGTTNEYTPIKSKEDEKNNEEQLAQTQNGGTYVNVGGSTANSYNSPNAIVNGGTVVNNGNNSNTNNTENNSDKNNNSDNDNKNDNNSSSDKNPVTNVTKIVKSINLRSVTAGSTFLDVNYFISDPESKYQIVYLYVTGPNYTNTIALDKTKELYRIEGLEPDTEYNITLGYRTTNINNKIESETEDIINVRTLKVQESLVITKVSTNRIYFNLKLDNNYAYDSAKIKVYVNDVEDVSLTQSINVSSAVSTNGWTSSIERPSGSKITLKLDGAIYNGVSVKTNLQASIKL